MFIHGPAAAFLHVYVIRAAKSCLPARLCLCRLCLAEMHKTLSDINEHVSAQGSWLPGHQSESSAFKKYWKAGNDEADRRANAGNLTTVTLLPAESPQLWRSAWSPSAPTMWCVTCLRCLLCCVSVPTTPSTSSVCCQLALQMQMPLRSSRCHTSRLSSSSPHQGPPSLRLRTTCHSTGSACLALLPAAALLATHATSACRLHRSTGACHLHKSTGARHHRIGHSSAQAGHPGSNSTTGLATVAASGGAEPATSCWFPAPALLNEGRPCCSDTSF